MSVKAKLNTPSKEEDECIVRRVTAHLLGPPLPINPTMDTGIYQNSDPQLL